MQTVGACLRGLREALAALVFPAPCRICGTLLDLANRIPLCRGCLASLIPLDGVVCSQCGRPFASPVVLEAEGLVLCHLCRRGLYDFDFARSYGSYSDAMVGAVILLKYHGVTPLAGWFAKRLEETFAGNREGFGADCVVPVPAYPARRRERGYNHAELIAKPLARALGLPCRSNLLMRTRPRPEKLRLSRKERWQSVHGAYTTRKRLRVDNLRVLLVDDVLTTGATLDACSRALRKAGASKVVALTVARAVPRWEASGLELPRRGPDA